MGQVKHGAENEGFLWKNEKNREVGFMTDLGKSKLLTGRKRPPYLWGSTSLLWHRDFLAVGTRLPCCGISISLLWRLDFPHEGVRNFDVSRLILRRVASKSAT